MSERERCLLCRGSGNDGHVDPNGEPNPSFCRACNGSGVAADNDPVIAPAVSPPTEPRIEALHDAFTRGIAAGIKQAERVSPPTEPNAGEAHYIDYLRENLFVTEERLEKAERAIDTERRASAAAIVRAENAEALLRDGLAATKDEYPVIHWRNRVRALLGEGTAPCGHEWRVSEHVTVRCSLDSGHVPALHSGDDSDGIRRVWLDEVHQWRPPEAPMSASAAGVHMRRASSEGR